jgi:hypothetical protein
MERNNNATHQQKAKDVPSQIINAAIPFISRAKKA